MIGLGWPLWRSAYPAGLDGVVVAVLVGFVVAAAIGYLWWVERTRSRPRPEERREELRKAA